MNKWEFAKQLFDWDGFKEHWKDIGADVKDEIFSAVTETSKDFWNNLTGTDKAAASDEAMKRIRAFNKKYKGTKGAPPGDGKQQVGDIAEEMKQEDPLLSDLREMEQEFKEHLAENYDEIGHLDFTEEMTDKELEDGLLEFEESAKQNEEFLANYEMQELAKSKPPYMRDEHEWLKRQEIEWNQPNDTARGPVEEPLEVEMTEYTPRGTEPIDPDYKDPYNPDPWEFADQEFGVTPYDPNLPGDVEMVNFQEFEALEAPLSSPIDAPYEVQPAPEWFRGVQADLEAPLLGDPEVADMAMNMMNRGGLVAEEFVYELEEGLENSFRLGWPTIFTAFSLMPGVIAWAIQTFGTRHPNKHQIGRLGYVSDRQIISNMDYNYTFSEDNQKKGVQFYLPCQVIDVHDFKTYTIGYKDIFQYPRKATFLRHRVHFLDFVMMGDQLAGEQYNEKSEWGGYLVFDEDTPLGWLKPIVRIGDNATAVKYYELLTLGQEVKLKENGRTGVVTRGYTFPKFGTEVNMDRYEITLHGTGLKVFVRPDEVLIEKTEEEKNRERAMPPFPPISRDPYNKNDSWFKGTPDYEWAGVGEAEHWMLKYRDDLPVDSDWMKMFFLLNHTRERDF